MLEIIGGPDRDRTDDLFHAMEARSQLRHRPTLRKDSFYSGRPQRIRQREREFFQSIGQVSRGTQMQLNDPMTKSIKHHRQYAAGRIRKRRCRDVLCHCCS